MCWIGKDNPRIVEKGEIVNVIKIVKITPEKTFIPYYVPYANIKTYEQGKTYKEIIKPNVCRTYTWIREGLHSYLAKKVTVVPETLDGKLCSPTRSYDEYRVRIYAKNDDSLIITHDTYTCGGKNTTHNPLRPEYAYISNSLHLALLIGHLPTGTKYYLNDDGAIVSDALTVDAIRPFSFDARYNLK